ncbi:unnamed protein product [Acanthoscelides obtectus]|uniref:PiggyBac transposable element-derived protein 4 C-terminal zinc-ribbon domain-containing protein n=1 Tax=Acanthoscelides obtectus TaxID=200917 RepID=A0A9P0PI21_ACAOB|nr:unnamed protein product [Acanthoscelides obtectus]CAK1670547.1 hypothetical protein AOBTE_LOCUS27663 [Acanthoscelides obtectus]
MDLLEFKLYIGKCLALGAQTTVSQDPRPSTPDEESSRPAKKCKKSEIPPRDVRTTGNEHLPICSVNNKNTYMRCRNLGCTKKTRFFCVKCEIYLCISPERQCFFEFHN